MTATFDGVPSVVAALSAVMGDVQSVGKDGFNKSQSYPFRGIDAVVNAVGPALRKHGVVCLPRVLWKEFGAFATKGGTTMHTATIEVEFTFVGPAGDTLVCSALGESADAGDKATSKAHSVAYRTALLQALCIPTSEPDPDETSYERAAPPERMSASQQTALAAGFERIAEAEESKTQLRKWWEASSMPPRSRWKSLTPEQADEVLMKLDELNAQVTA